MIAEQQQEVIKVGGLEQRNQTILISVHAVGIVSSVYRVRGSAVIAYKQSVEPQHLYSTASVTPSLLITHGKSTTI